MIACIFAGQGSQYVGMGTRLAEASAAARKIYDDAAKVAGIDLLTLDESQLAQTRYAQLAIVTLSLAAFAAFREAGQTSQELAFAGFSLGEYSALSAAGILDTTAVLRLVEERSRLMQLAAEANPGAMYAILGLDDARVEAVLAQPEFASQVYPVNYNCPGQLVIAGAAAETAAAADALKAAGAKRALKLNVSGAFHTRFMSDAAPGLASFASALPFAQPTGALYANRTGDAIPAGIDWPVYLADHLCHAVLWTREVESLAAAGATTFIEFGPGKVLSGLVKKILPGARIANVEDPDSLAAAWALLQS